MKHSPLVLDGSEIKLRLEAERIESGSMVHVDWLRFTCLLRNAEPLATDFSWPKPARVTWMGVEKKLYSGPELLAALQGAPESGLNPLSDSDYSAHSQALQMALEVAEALGDGFTVSPEPKKGQDFYKFRFSIIRQDVECGWVGFLSSSDSPRQQAQSKTIHTNIYGAACTFAAAGWRDRLADLIEQSQGVLTRCDLALDFFDGLPGGLDGVVSEYQSGVCDVGGRRLKSSCVGDWLNGRSRSLYFGSKESGKQTNVYEKGDQLFGEKANSPWLRVELRYGNKLRVLPVDMLRRPSDFFAGASDWHGSVLARAGASAAAEGVSCAVRRPLETVKAEVVRNLRWAMDTAAPTIAAAFEFLGDEFLELCTNKKLPGRLSKFSRSELRAAFASGFGQYFSASGGSPSLLQSA
jgi:phage replication initiation protein